MSGNVLALTPGLQGGDASPATARVPVNFRVNTASFAIGVLPEVVQFAGPSVTGTWTVGTTRVSIGGLPAINTASAGISIGPPPASVPTGPMRIIQPDPRVSAL